VLEEGEEEEAAPEAVTTRPEMGREQLAHVAVGTPARVKGLSQGRREEGFAVGSFPGVVFDG
jgi:hypothetical protein